MTAKQLLSLKRGDKVHWDDPDGGIRSRDIEILTIRIKHPLSSDSMIQIIGMDASYLECYSHELTQTLNPDLSLDQVTYPQGTAFAA